MYKILEKLNNDSKDGKTYRERFDLIKGIYKSQIDTDVVASDAQYTPHDYERHCNNIFLILSTVVLDDSTYGKGENQLNTEELFILCVAVLLHDLHMVISPDERDDHGERAYNYVIENVFRYKNSALSHLLSDGEAKFIAETIYGHSDIKDGKKIIKSTIDELGTKKTQVGNMAKQINTQRLAALLRIADELDINSERVRGKNLFRKRLEENSEKHWRKCDLFTYPQKNKDDRSIIHLMVSDLKIEMEDNFENDITSILEVRKKIFNELDELNNKVFDKVGLDGWYYKKVELFSESTRIKEALLKKEQNPFFNEDVAIGNIIESKLVDEEILKKNEPSLKNPLDKKLSEKLKKKIIEDKLLLSGHFYLGENKFARDWIDTERLFNHKNKNLIEDVVLCFNKKVKMDFENEDVCFLGEGFIGTMVASDLAILNNSSFSYLISKKNDGHYTEHEKKIFDLKGKKVILVIDSLVTGATIENLLNVLENKWQIGKESILAIFSIFYRKPYICKSKVDTTISKDIYEKLYILNADFHIEICGKDTCLFTENCIIKHKYEPIDI